MTNDKDYIKGVPQLDKRAGYRPPKAIVPPKGAEEKPVEKPSSDSPEPEKKD